MLECELPSNSAGSWCIGAICLIVSVSPVCAQTALAGTVKDPSQSVVPRATVFVKNRQTGFTWKTQTSDVGLYHFSLPVGNYDATFAAPGFQSVKHTDLLLTVGAAVTIDVELALEGAAAALTVVAGIPVVETARTSISTTVTSEAVVGLPVNGRNFLDFAVLSPGVVRDARAGDLSFEGQRGPSNSLLVDGVDSNNLFFGQALGRAGFRPYTFSIDSVQEFQINTNGFTAETGRAIGGVINVVTKSGANTFHGSVFEFYRDRALNAPTFFENKAGIPKQSYHFNQFGGTLGGPLIRDTLFFFGSYDGQRNQTSQPVAPNIYPSGAALAQLGAKLQPYTLGNNNDVFLAKIDWNIRPSQRLELRYNGSRFDGPNTDGAALNGTQEHTGNTRIFTDQPVLHYTRILGPQWIWESQISFERDDEPVLANATGVETNIVNGISFGKRAFDPYYSNQRIWQGVSTLSRVIGRHTLKTGIDLLFLRVNNYFPGNFAGSYTFPSYAAYLAGTPSSFIQAFARTGPDAPIDHPDDNETGLYVQDSWRPLPNLTINAGLRYDRFGYRQPTTLNADPGLAAANLRTDRIAIDNHNFGPRLGVAWSPLADQKTVLRAGYGLFYSRTPSILLNRALLQNGIDVVTYNLSANLPAYPNIFAAPPGAGKATPSVEIVAPNFKTQEAQQFSFQVERQLGASYALTMGYMGTRSLHLIRPRDINLYPSVLVQGQISNAGPVLFWRHPGTAGPFRANANFGRITLYDTGADSYYHAGFVQVHKRFSSTVQILSSYTFSKVIDTNPVAVVSPGSPDYDVTNTQDTLLPNLDRGPGNNDVRHRLVASALWDPKVRLLNNWKLSTIVQAQSGVPFSVGATGDPGNDGNNYNDRAPLTGRNTLRGRNLVTVDVRVARNIPLVGDRIKLMLLVEAFNMLNHPNFATLQTTRYVYGAGVFTPLANFGAPLSVYGPGVGSRVLQLGAKLRF